jgi:hypothetical protein
MTPEQTPDMIPNKTPKPEKNRIPTDTSDNYPNAAFTQDIIGRALERRVYGVAETVEVSHKTEEEVDWWGVEFLTPDTQIVAEVITVQRPFLGTGELIPDFLARLTVLAGSSDEVVESVAIVSSNGSVIHTDRNSQEHLFNEKDGHRVLESFYERNLINDGIPPTPLTEDYLDSVLRG